MYLKYHSEQLTIFLQTFYRLFGSKTQDMLTNDATKMTLAMFTASFLVSLRYYTDAALFFKYCCPQKRSHMFSIKPFSNQEHSTSQFGICKCQEKLSNSKSKLITQASLFLSADLT